MGITKQSCTNTTYLMQIVAHILHDLELKLALPVVWLALYQERYTTATYICPTMSSLSSLS
jgi:hypothetical protein